MPRIRSIADIRAGLGDVAKDYSDEELLKAVSAATGTPLPQAAEKYGYDTAKGPWSEKASASVDQYQAGMYGLGEDIANRIGWTDAGSALGRRRVANEISADISTQRATAGGIPDNWRDVDGIGSGLRFVGGQAVGAAPYLVEAAAGGVVGRGLRLAAGGVRASELARGGVATAEEIAAARKGEALASVAGGTAANYPSSVANIMQTQRQEPGGDTNLGAAAALGVPFAALNGAVGVGSLASRTALPRIISPVMDGIQGVKGRLARAGAAGVEEAVQQGAAQTGQEMLNQLGRMSVNEQQTFLNEESKKRYADSFVGGAAFGGLVGLGLSGGRRSSHYRGDSSPLDTTSGGEATPPAPHDLLAPPPAAPVAEPLRLGFDPNVSSSAGIHDNNPFYVFPDGSTALHSEAALQHSVKPQPADPEPAPQMNVLHPDEPVAEPVAQTAAPVITGDAPAPTPIIPEQQEPGKGSAAPDSGVQEPVQHSGTPEALAAVEQSRQRVSSAKDAISRAQEAGMTSEKQQTAFWRAEELVNQGKLDESKMTQAIALLLQSKYGKVKSMLDDAAAGAPHEDLLAKYDAIDAGIKEMDKHAADQAAAHAELKAARDDPEAKASAVAKAESKVAAASAKHQAAFDHVQRLKGDAVEDPNAKKTPVVDPAVADAHVEAALPSKEPVAAEKKPSTPTQEPATLKPADTPVQRLKSAAEVANKIRRYESFLACLGR